MGGTMDAQSRKWQITINNPSTHNLDHDSIKQALSGCKDLIYWCMCDEVGDECETLHTHVYLHTYGPKPATWIQKRFPNMHREIVVGSDADNRAYILKDGEKFNKDDSGHYSYTDKKKKLHEGTNYSDTFYEEGTAEESRQGKRKDADVVVSMIKSGASDMDIIDAVPSAYRNLEHIQLTRSMYRADRFKTEWRNLTVVYIFGKTGLGKTRSVMESFGYTDVYRVTDYKKYPFDDYEGEDVVMLEEFRSSFPIGDILKYLDGYPLRLTARFKNKQACFTKVFIVTNDPPEMQYKNVDLDSVSAFWRRISEIREFVAPGEYRSYKTLDEYKRRYKWVNDAKRAEVDVHGTQKAFLQSNL